MFAMTQSCNAAPSNIQRNGFKTKDEILKIIYFEATKKKKEKNAIKFLKSSLFFTTKNKNKNEMIYVYVCFKLDFFVV